MNSKSKIWHPFTQHSLGEPIIKIERAKDEFLYTENGETIIDGISSWWVNTLGHSNPRITKAISEQAEKLQQVIFAGFTHTPAEEVAAKIKRFLPPELEYAFFSDSGSTSVEVALKMAVGYFHNKGIKNKTKIVAFEHAYHGDTFGGMASGGRSVFNQPYTNMLFDVIHLPFPQKGQENTTISAFKEILQKQSSEIAAIIIEPLILGSGGMLMYEAFVIDELYKLAKEHGVFFILDEVMTGFGRTGTMFAFEQTNIVPDIICLSKGLTGGNLPLALTLATKEIYEAFYSKNKADMFFHSSSYTANPIACAAACANLEFWGANVMPEQKVAALQETSLIRNLTYEIPDIKNNCQNQQIMLRDDDKGDNKQNILDKVAKINKYHLKKKEQFEQNEFVKNPRVLGSIFAFDIKTENEGYLADIATDLYRFYLENGVLLRPLGNTVYIMPPYCISEESLGKIYDVIKDSINQAILLP